MATTVLNTNISEVENKIPQQDKYIAAPEFIKLTAEHFIARLEQTNFMTKTDFDKRLPSFNKRIVSN